MLYQFIILETQTLLSPSVYKSYFEKAIVYSDYMALVEKDAALNNQTDEHLSKIPLNLQRMKRINKTMQLTEQALNALQHNNQNRKWLVITENWCGDSAQITPVINAIAEHSNGKIELCFIYRDQHPELIEAHLTNGGKAIPKLLQFNEQFEITDQWGPRPVEAIALVKELKNNPETSGNYAKHLHKWYTSNEQVAIQNELAKLLK